MKNASPPKRNVGEEILSAARDIKAGRGRTYTPYEGIKKGLEDVLAYVQGDLSAVGRIVHVVTPADIKAARKKVGLSRNDFARVFGLSPTTLRKWENGERRPRALARALFTIINREPEAALRAIRK